MFKDKIKKLTSNGENKDGKNNRKIENLVFLIIILIVTVLIINNIFKVDSNSTKGTTESKNKVLANIKEENNVSLDLEKRLADILATIKGVSNVDVFINYSQSSSTVPIYDETTTTSSTSETDSEGGIRNVTETQSQKAVTFKESRKPKRNCYRKDY